MAEDSVGTEEITTMSACGWDEIGRYIMDCKLILLRGCLSHKYPSVLQI